MSACQSSCELQTHLFLHPYIISPRSGFKEFNHVIYLDYESEARTNRLISPAHEWNVSFLPITLQGYEMCPVWSVTTEWQLAGDYTVHMQTYASIHKGAYSDSLLFSVQQSLRWRIMVLGTFCRKTRADVMCNFPSSDFQAGLSQQGAICCSPQQSPQGGNVNLAHQKQIPPNQTIFQLTPSSCPSTSSHLHQQGNHLCKPA